MKRIAQFLLLSCLFLSCKLSLQASLSPDEALPESWNPHIDLLVQHLETGNVEALAALIQYPLLRPTPLPNIHNEAEFIDYYPYLFGDGLDVQLIETPHSQASSILKPDHIGLLNGAIWLNSQGQIIRVNHESPLEAELQAQLEAERKANTHPSVAEWESNIFTCTCETGSQLRLDRVNEQLPFRLAIWDAGQAFTEAPSLIMHSNFEEFYGTMGGVGYFFEQDEVLYVLEDIHMAEREQDLGLRFRVESLLEGHHADQSYTCQLGK